MTIAPASIDELGTRLRTGEVTAVALAEEALRAIERAEPALNAYITVTTELALEQAAAVDAQLARGADPGPVGIQLIGRLGEDERLLDVAEWAEAALAEAS